MFTADGALDKIESLQQTAERAALLLNEVIEQVLCEYEGAAERNDRMSIMMFAEIESHRTRVKADIILEMIENINNELRALIKSAYTNQEPEPRDSEEATNTPTEEEMREMMTTETLNQINDFVSIIEAKPDFLRRMATLKKTAMLLATGHEIHLAELPQK